MRRSPWIRAGALVIAISTLLATALAFVSVVSTDDGDEPPEVELSPALTADPATEALGELLPDGPLDGMVRSTDDLGPLTLEDAAAEYPFGDPDGVRLEANGFRRGYSRGWVGADGRSAHVVVYEMGDPAGFHQAWQAAVSQLADGRFPTPVGDGITDVEADTEASIVAWVEGDHWYYVVHFGPAGADGASHVRTIVEAVQAG